MQQFGAPGSTERKKWAAAVTLKQRRFERPMHFSVGVFKFRENRFSHDVDNTDITSSDGVPRRYLDLCDEIIGNLIEKKASPILEEIKNLTKK